MRLLLVLETDWVSRGPAQHHHLLERLQNRGHTVRIIDFDIHWSSKKGVWPWSRRETISAPSKVIGKQSMSVIRPGMVRAPLLSYASYIPSFTVELIRQIRSFRPDLVIGEGVLNVFLASRIAKMFGVPFVRYLLDSDYTLIPETYLQPLGFWLEKQGLVHVDGLFAINKQLGNYAGRMGAKTDPIVITAGIDKSRFNAVVDGSEIRNELQYSNDVTVLFFMGWLYDFSGLRELSNALAKLSESNLRLLILGRGDLYDELKEIAKKSAIPNMITLIDWVSYEEVPRYIAAADICLLPALLNKTMRDIVPIKLYEYLACGKPVICTRLPGVMREFGDSSGLVYVRRPEDIPTIALRIAQNPDEYTRRSKEALSYVTNLDWKLLTDHFEEALERIIEIDQ